MKQLLEHCIYGYCTSVLENTHWCYHNRIGNWETEISSHTLFLAITYSQLPSLASVKGLNNNNTLNTFVILCHIQQKVMLYSPYPSPPEFQGKPSITEDL